MTSKKTNYATFIKLLRKNLPNCTISYSKKFDNIKICSTVITKFECEIIIEYIKDLNLSHFICVKLNKVCYVLDVSKK